MSTLSAKQEWAARWPLPLLALLGIMGSATFAYSSGVFMVAMTGEFGWSRAQFSSAFAVQMLLGLIVGPTIGRLVDRKGPRRVGLIGIFIFVIGLSAMGLANGKIWQWWLLGAVQAVCTSFVAGPVWLSAVLPHFKASRGLALAVSLAGIGVATSLWPVLAAAGIQHIGWRWTYAALGIIWAVVILPVAFRLLEDPVAPTAAEVAKAKADAEQAGGITYRQAILSRTFFCLMLGGGVFSCVAYGLTLHLVPMLELRGLTLSGAASLVSIMGIFVIGGRLATGFLLDKLPTRPLSVIIFILPIGVCAMMWLTGGFTIPVAVAMLGLATGAETDIVVFLISRRFPRQIFASVYATMAALFALFASAGPLFAGAIYDADKSYDRFFMYSIPLTTFAVILIALVPKARVGEHGH